MRLSPAEQSARVIHRVYLAAGSAGIARDVSFADFVEENLRDHAADFVVGVVQALQREKWYDDSDPSDPVACFYTCSNRDLLRQQITVYLGTQQNDLEPQDWESLQHIVAKAGDH